MLSYSSNKNFLAEQHKKSYYQISYPGWFSNIVLKKKLFSGNILVLFLK